MQNFPTSMMQPLKKAYLLLILNMPIETTINGNLLTLLHHLWLTSAVVLASFCQSSAILKFLPACFGDLKPNVSGRELARPVIGRNASIERYQ